MLYVSDHGESLGEHGLYLHGAPYSIAPEAQTHIAAIVWLGKHFDYSIEQIRRFQNHELSHDDLFCILLAGFEIDSTSCPDNRKMLKEKAH
jgi:lipid A ethanolaminephosphotransferase